jgi:hypothetical protein
VTWWVSVLLSLFFACHRFGKGESCTSKMFYQRRKRSLYHI